MRNVRAEIATVSMEAKEKLKKYIPIWNSLRIERDVKLKIQVTEREEIKVEEKNEKKGK